MTRLARTLVFVALGLAGCGATVPQEIVELSYATGQDLAAVHDSYKQLIHSHFDSLRAERQDYLDREWKPRFIERFIADGRLVDIANGKVVWSADKQDFADPGPKAKEELLASVGFWAEAALQQIDGKRTELMAPLDADEAELSASVDEAFQQLYLSNATITAHLNSIRKLQKVEDDALKALHVSGLREKINKALVEGAHKAKSALDDIKQADQKAEGVKDAVKSKVSDVKSKLDEVKGGHK